MCSPGEGAKGRMGLSHPSAGPLNVEGPESLCGMDIKSEALVP